MFSPTTFSLYKILFITTTLAFNFFNISGAILYDAPFAQSITIVFPDNAFFGNKDVKNFSYCFIN